MTDESPVDRDAQARWCARCGVRSATRWLRRVDGEHGVEAQPFCEDCFREGESDEASTGRRGPLDEDLADELPAGIPVDGEQGLVVPIRQPIHQIDITQRFSDETHHVLRSAAQGAMSVGRGEVDTDDLLGAALTEAVGASFFEQAGGDPEAVRSQLGTTDRTADADETPPRLSPDAKGALIAAFEESLLVGADHIGPEHLLVALALEPEYAARAAFEGQRMTIGEMRGHLARLAPPKPLREPRSRTPTLDAFGRDLTAVARAGRLDPVVGREAELDQIEEILARRVKSTPILLGAPGVGKTAIIDALAQRIANGEASDHLTDRRIIALELELLLAGTAARGSFEERLVALIDEATAQRDHVLVFIDEMHRLMEVGQASGSLSAAEILKPRLGPEGLQLLGATTTEAYRRHIEADAAMSRRFVPVRVAEPPVGEAVQILNGLRDRFEAFHRVWISDDAIEAAVELTARYVHERFLPDKAVDFLDQAGARARLRRRRKQDAQAELDGGTGRRSEADTHPSTQACQGDQPDDTADQPVAVSRPLTNRQTYPTVSAEDVAEVVARATGIPVTKVTQKESQRLLDLDQQLMRRVLGQDHAVRTVVDAIRRNRAGLSDPRRPTGSFLLLGPTGVGKTELAKSLADVLFGDADAMVRFDMSEFQESHAVARLIGAPPGYVGYEDAGELTERLRQAPYSVVLLDEIEKAHRDLSNVLLQLLDDGRLTDTHGRTVDGRHAVILMTSNVGSAQTVAGYPTGFVGRDGGSKRGAALERHTLAALRQEFAPEFLNRIDDIVVFQALSLDSLRAIARLMLDEVEQRLGAKGIHLDVTDEALDLLARLGMDPDYGARPLRRAVERTIVNSLARDLLSQSLREGLTAVVEVRDGELVTRVAEGEAVPEATTEMAEAPLWEPGRGETRQAPQQRQ